jgi:hypothetical protein
MIFVVALDPASIRACATQGALGCDHLIGVLLALSQNCLMAETEGTWRISSELKEAIAEIPDQGARKIAAAVLEKLLAPDRNKFVEVIEDDGESVIGDLLAIQSENIELDAIICEQCVPFGQVESTSILAFNQSNFSRERNRKACSLIYAPGEIEARDVLMAAFGRIASHCDSLEIYDRQMGVSMGGNYHDAIEHWCRFFVSFDRSFELRVHTTSAQAASVKRKFAQHLEDSKVMLKVFAHDENDQPHDRFLRACSFTFDIGRGIDLFDRYGYCRDVKVGLSDHGAFSKQWRNLASAQPI